MSLPQSFRAQQTTDTTGTGTLALNAADTSRRSFYTAAGASSIVVHYLISQSGSSSWEIGIGTFNGADPGTLTRTSVIASTNGGSAVSWGAGRKDVALLQLPGQRVRTGFTGATTAALADIGGLLDFTGSTTTTLTLPAVATVPAGAGYLIRNTGTVGAVLTIDPNGAETIGGATTLVIYGGESVEIWNTGSAWLHSALPSMPLIYTQTISGAPSNVNFVLPVTAALYAVRFAGVTLSVDGQIGLRTSTDGGTNYDAGASDYGTVYDFNSGASGSNKGAAAASSILLTDAADGAVHFAGSFEFFSGDGTYQPRVMSGQSSYADTAGTLLQGGTFQGGRASVTAANAIRLFPSSGVFGNGGKISLYQIRR
jgi:hypothetical protein